MNHTRLSVLAVLIVTGSAMPTLAGEPTTPGIVSASSGDALDFRSASWLLDRKVVNDNGEVIARVSDLILDRGSARAEFLVIKTAGASGGDHRLIAVPYSAFRAEGDGAERYVLACTAEQLKQHPEYSAERWRSLKEPGADANDPLHRAMSKDRSASADPYAGSLNGAERLRVRGEVVGVERARSTFGEQVVITVRTDDGPSRRVALGPSWYVNATPAAPMRGDRVDVDTLVLPRDPQNLLVGTDLRVEDRKLRVRSADGAPAWALDPLDYGGKAYGASGSRSMLLSELIGVGVDCRGSECGKVDDVLLDRASGEVGFLSIDPNENFLGINDTKRLIPWSIATVALDGRVRLDASKQMVLDSVETPSDVSRLNSGGFGESVYRSFGVPAPRHERATPTRPQVPGSADAWTASGPIARALESGETRLIEGSVIEMIEQRFDSRIASARGVRVRPIGAGAEPIVVLLGPVTYLDGQKPVCKVGDTVKINASRASINNDNYWLARSVDCVGSRVVLVDERNSPVWAQR